MNNQNNNEYIDAKKVALLFIIIPLLVVLVILWREIIDIFRSIINSLHQFFTAIIRDIKY